MKRKYTVTTNGAETTKLLRNATDGYMRGAYIEPVYNINYMSNKAGVTVSFKET